MINTTVPAAIVRILQLDDATVRALYGITKVEWFGKRPSIEASRESFQRMQKDARYFTQNGDYSTADRAAASRFANRAL